MKHEVDTGIVKGPMCSFSCILLTRSLPGFGDLSRPSSCSTASESILGLFAVGLLKVRKSSSHEECSAILAEVKRSKLSDASIRITPNSGPKVHKHCILRAVWILGINL